MTQYGFYDNDIMDEVLASDMIYATKATPESTIWKDSWFEDSFRGGSWGVPDTWVWQKFG